MLNRKEIEDKVIEVVTETLALEKPAHLDDHFQEDLGADSIDLVTLVVTLQDELNGSFEVSDVKDRHKLRDMVDFIENFIRKESATA